VEPLQQPEQQQPEQQQSNAYAYRVHEGAVLRGEGRHGIGLEVYHPGRGWVPYGNLQDWWEGRELTEQEAQARIAKD
jgi:hypothetical protein